MRNTSRLLVAGAIATAVFSMAGAGEKAHGPVRCPAKEGWASPTESLFSPVLRLAPPGPDRARRAVERLSRSIPVTHAILFHPRLDPALENLGERLPLRLSSLIRGASLWAEPGIPWRHEPDGSRFLAFRGFPENGHFVYSPARAFTTPKEARRYAGRISLRPIAVERRPGERPERIVAELDAELRFDTFGLARFVDFLSEMPRHVLGDPTRDVDARPGEWNAHDDSTLARFRRDLPTLAAAVLELVELRNVVDVLGDDEPRRVVTNVDARVRPEALAPYPHLRRFFDRVLRRTMLRVDVTNEKGNPWLRFAWEHGRMRGTALSVAGRLAPMNEDLAPVGPPLGIDRVERGRFRSVTTLRLDALGVQASVQDVVFTNAWERRDETVDLEATLEGMPQIEGSPVLGGILRYAAGEFLGALATGRGGRGTTITVHSRILPGGDALLAARLRAEVVRAPGLETVARIADLFSNVQRLEVREDQRRLFGSLHTAMAEDWERAIPSILRLDRCETNQGDGGS